MDFVECVGRQYRAKIGRSSNILAWRNLILVSKFYLFHLAILSSLTELDLQRLDACARSPDERLVHLTEAHLKDRVSIS